MICVLLATGAAANNACAEALEKSDWDGLYTEVGVQVWLSKNVGLNTSLKYHITTEGRKFYYRISTVGMYMQF